MAEAAHTDEALDRLRSRLARICDGGRINRFSTEVVAEFEQAIAARVRAAFHVPQIARASSGWGVFCAACSAEVGDYVYPCRLPDTAGWWSEFPRRLGQPVADSERDARVRAEERQRIAALVKVDLLTDDDVPDWSDNHEGWNRAIEKVWGLIAAGSAVPVATPGVTLTRDALDGGWVAEFTALPGCMSQGETIAEALRNVADAITEAAVEFAVATPGGACELCSAGDHAACSAAREDSYCCCPVPFPGPVAATPTEPAAPKDLLTALQDSLDRARRPAEQDGQR